MVVLEGTGRINLVICKEISMGFYVERIIISNRAPFANIDLSFKDKSISVLTALNGKGKTTILSYIVDAWIEMTRDIYSNSYVGRERNYYRVSTPLYDIDLTKPSVVYIRFNTGEAIVDYLDMRNVQSAQSYERIIPLPDKIPSSSLKRYFEKGESIKVVSKNFQKKEDVKKVFDNTLLTYFPSYRFELPNFLNDKYAQDVVHKLESGYSGRLKNPLEVTSGIKDIANWILDVVLDWEVNSVEITLADGSKVEQAPEYAIWRNIKKVLECALISKFPNRNVRFGVGRRSQSGSRLAVMQTHQDGKSSQYCPTIFNLSSGELSILAIFVEILRQCDVTFGMIPMNTFHGVVLIDEVDKHLHIQLQKEVLPLLFNLFPNVQFIITSHSPFLNMGLAEIAMDRTKIYDLDNNGLESSPTTNLVYEQAYELFLDEKNKYAQMYNKLMEEVGHSNKTLIITEGKTDVKHLKAALTRLNIEDLDLEFFEIGEQQWGDSQLKSMAIHLSQVKHTRRIIAVFDRDSDEYINFASEGSLPYRSLGNNVFAFAIPLVNETEYGDKISIEHYYLRRDLLSFDRDNRRLFLGDEFYTSGNSKDGQYQTKVSKIQNKVAVNGIIDDKVFKRDDLEQLNSIACTKDQFAEDVLNSADRTFGFDFSNFNRIFALIRQILAVE